MDEIVYCHCVLQLDQNAINHTSANWQRRLQLVSVICSFENKIPRLPNSLFKYISIKLGPGPLASLLIESGHISIQLF